MTDASEGIDLDGLRALAEKATPGPWEADGNEVSQHWSRPEPWKTVASSEVACMSYCYGGSGRGIENEADAEFIAAANPSTVLALVERVREAERLAAVRRDTIATYERENADWSIRVHAAERRIEKAEDFITRHYLDTDMGRDVLAALTEGDKQ